MTSLFHLFPKVTEFENRSCFQIKLLSKKKGKVVQIAIITITEIRAKTRKIKRKKKEKHSLSLR